MSQFTDKTDSINNTHNNISDMTHFDLSNYDFSLDDSKIAIKPYEKRDEAKLLVYSKSDSQIKKTFFSDIINYFNSGDMLVLNETKVFKARLYGEKEGTGAQIEFLLLKRTGETEFESLVRPARRVQNGTRVRISGGALSAEIISRLDSKGAFLVRLIDNTEEHAGKKKDIYELIDECGFVPLPPYIVKNKDEKKDFKSKDSSEDINGYQTVYARHTGSVAAPTAGFHFTEELLKKLSEKGVIIEKVTLHVGLGTFKLVESEDIRDHSMHSEQIKISAESYRSINDFVNNKNGRKLFCCGTTSVRTIESMKSLSFNSESNCYEGETRLFIYPGYKFNFVDAIITNFHLPKSTLLMMISAFMGINEMKKAYQFAINNEFLFYSYGDAMLII